jgi:hypothetical protein
MPRYHFPTPLSVALGFKGALLAEGLRATLPRSHPGRQTVLVYDPTTDTPHIALTVRTLGSTHDFELYAHVSHDSALRARLDRAWRQLTTVTWSRIVLVYGRRRTRRAA